MNNLTIAAGMRPDTCDHCKRVLEGTQSTCPFHYRDDKNGFPWCESCRSYHHPDNPTCAALSEGGKAALEALVILKRYATKLRPKKEKCSGCGLNHWDDLEAHKTQVTLNSIIEKLRSMAAKEKGKK